MSLKNVSGKRSLKVFLKKISLKIWQMKKSFDSKLFSNRSSKLQVESLIFEFYFVFCLLHVLTNFEEPISGARFISVGWWFINTKFLRIMDEQGDVWEVKIKPRNLLKNNYGYFWLKMKWTIKMMTRKMRLRRASKGSKHFLNFLLINNLK